MRSALSPERLEIELQSRLGPTLSRKGYRVVGHGPSGVTWRRDLSGKVIVGMAALGVLALGGFVGGGIGEIVFGIACLAGAAALFFFRGPATVTVGLARAGDGTELELTGGRDAKSAQEIVRAVAGLPPGE